VPAAILSCEKPSSTSALPKEELRAKGVGYKENFLQDEWLGYYYKRIKIGYLHELIKEKGKHYEVSGDGTIRLQMGGGSEEAQVNYKTVLNKDLIIENFFYKLSSNGREIIVTGVKRGRKLVVKIQNADLVTETSEDIPENIYSANSVRLYLLKRGFREKDNFQLRVFFEPLRKISVLKVDVIGKERIKMGGREIEAFKVRQSVEGLSSIGWYEPGGRIVREISFEGFEARAETEKVAKSFGDSSIDMEKLISFLKVKTNKEIKDPEKVSRIKVCLKNISDKNIILENQRQRILRYESFKDGFEKSSQIILEVNKEDFDVEDSAQIPIEKYNLYLQPTFFIQADNPAIKKIVMDILNGEKNAYKFSKKTVKWIMDNIERKLVENFSALDTLKSREGECQSISYLYAAFLRAAKIPCRLVGGIVYSKDLKGFVHHAWCQAFLGEWIDIDPTFGQIPADATHIAFFYGELGEELKLLKLLGRLEVDLLEIDYDKM